MAKQQKIFPPLDNRRTTIKRRLLRLAINFLVLLGAGVLYYAIFASFFDTPSEFSLRRSADQLRREYAQLSKRIAEVEEVLGNVSQRDSNVFRIMFESKPYDLDEYSSTLWSRKERLLGLSNRELSEEFFDRTEQLSRRTKRLDLSLEDIYETASGLGENINNIPAIQPIINNDLTLLTASFGMRIHPFYKSLSQHKGVDFTVPEGSRVFATADGVVSDASNRTSSSGLTLTIDHGNGYETRYSHLGEVFVRKGQRINRGDIIAATGNTGLSLAPHLHYEVYYEGEAVDPVNYFFLELTPKQYHSIKQIAQSGMQAFD